MESDKNLTLKFWPYRILKRSDDQIKSNLRNIIEHFESTNKMFDIIVFVPYAGTYLGRLFKEIYNHSYQINYVTVRRVSTISQDNLLKNFVFKRKWLSDIMRHLDVLLRLIKYGLGIPQKIATKPEIHFDVKGKKILVIDDDVATGTTLELIKSKLLEKGASSVTTASISNHFLPNRIHVDYSVYRFALLRTKNSRDYNAV